MGHVYWISGQEGFLWNGDIQYFGPIPNVVAQKAGGKIVRESGSATQLVKDRCLSIFPSQFAHFPVACAQESENTEKYCRFNFQYLIIMQCNIPMSFHYSRRKKFLMIDNHLCRVRKSFANSSLE